MAGVSTATAALLPVLPVPAPRRIRVSETLAVLILHRMGRQVRLSIAELKSVDQIRASIGGAVDCDEGGFRSLTVGILDRLLH